MTDVLVWTFLIVVFSILTSLILEISFLGLLIGAFIATFSAILVGGR